MGRARLLLADVTNQTAGGDCRTAGGGMHSGMPSSF